MKVGGALNVCVYYDTACVYNLCASLTSSVSNTIDGLLLLVLNEKYSSRRSAALLANAFSTVSCYGNNATKNTPLVTCNMYM